MRAARELLGGIIEAVKADAGEGESADEADPVSEVWVSSDGGTASPQPQPQPAGGEQQAAEPAPAEVVVKVEEGEEGEEAEVQEEEQEEEEPEAPAAVKQPPKHVSNVRAWLGGLGFQRHSDGQRSPSQRTPEGQTREEAAAAPSGATAAAAAAIQQQITGLKAALAVQQQGQPLSAAPEAAAAAQRPANGVLGKKRSLAEMSQSFSGGGCQAQSGGSAGASKAPRLGSQQGGSGGAPSGSGAAAFGPELEGEWCRIYWPEEDNWWVALSGLGQFFVGGGARSMPGA